MTLLDDFQRVNREHPCPICEKADWCLVSKDDPHSPSKVLCARVESEVRFAEAGWLHSLREDGPKSKVPFRMTLRLSEPSKTNFQSLSDSFRAALNEMPLTGLADHLGLAVESLDRLHVGWASANALRAAHTQCKGPGAWSFPMSDANGRVLGIRLRTRGGFKYSITGSRSGLFIPADLDTKKVLLIAEGPTDTAALLGLGFCAVGIPSCGSAFAQVRSLILKLRVAKIVVVADGDDVGIRGAHRLAMSLRPYCANVRVLIPQGGGKDIRQWINSGATNADITKAIDKARTIGLKFKVRVSAGGK